LNSFIEAIKIVGYKSLTFCGHPDLCKNFIDTSIGNFEPELDVALQNADVVMGLRIQNERLSEKLTIGAKDYIERYQINVDSLQVADPAMILLHPGPVNFGIELSKEASELENCKIRDQIFNGVGMRMAVLTRLFSQA
jgi:aspartate carbamoyltransferase catalytic subunit